ncbi:hypothetical protein C8R47DRAFT_1282993 [Mycena vitilis]|nr:hypothetical protein C8R47DRAFT_1282993 [Mycena vitilis]
MVIVREGLSIMDTGSGHPRSPSDPTTVVPDAELSERVTRLEERLEERLDEIAKNLRNVLQTVEHLDESPFIPRTIKWGFSTARTSSKALAKAHVSIIVAADRGVGFTVKGYDIIGPAWALSRDTDTSAAPYGMSKAVNALVKVLDTEHPALVTMAIEPRRVATCMGNNGGGASTFGLKQTPVALDDSVAGILSRIDGATKEKSSGKFWNFKVRHCNPWDVETEDPEMPWYTAFC